MSPRLPQEANGWQEGKDPAVCTFGDGVRDMKLGPPALREGSHWTHGDRDP